MDYQKMPSPCFVLQEAQLRKNLEWIDEVQQGADIDVILAFKGFAMWSTFPLIRTYLPGATASSLHEARLCFEEMGVKAHSYSPVYIAEEMEEIMSYSSHLTFNSLSQIQFFEKEIKAKQGEISFGLRVNPEYSDVETDLYNPCAPGSRLGVLAEQIGDHLPKGIEGLHFHTLCESSSFALEKTLAAFEEKFAKYFHQIKWVNFGGGHLMTGKDYDRPHLIQLLKRFKEKYKLKVILEPGSAIAWETGVLVSTVLDIVENKGIQTAMLDISFTAHQPDTLEMPYRPNIIGASDKMPDKPSYRLGGISCLSGDFVEEYSFDEALKIGDRIIFLDMMHYTMVKSSTFNGVKHPSIGIWREDGQFDLIRQFGYEDFKNKLS